jgi:hypothetical protein
MNGPWRSGDSLESGYRGTHDACDISPYIPRIYLPVSRARTSYIEPSVISVIGTLRVWLMRLPGLDLSDLLSALQLCHRIISLRAAVPAWDAPERE